MKNGSTAFSLWGLCRVLESGREFVGIWAWVSVPTFWDVNMFSFKNMRVGQGFVCRAPGVKVLGFRV